MTTRTTRTTAAKPSLMSRLRGQTAPRSTRTTRSTRHGLGGGTTTTTTTKTTKTTHHPTGATGTVPATHHRRRPGLGDKISGALLKLKGSLTRRPGQKAAGTRRMHGTDGRGARTRRRESDHAVEVEPTSDTIKTRAPSIVAADTALSTAVELVSQVQDLQAHVVELELALATNDAKTREAPSESQPPATNPTDNTPLPPVQRANTFPVTRSQTLRRDSVLEQPSRKATLIPVQEHPATSNSSASSLSDVKPKEVVDPPLATPSPAPISRAPTLPPNGNIASDAVGATDTVVDPVDENIPASTPAAPDPPVTDDTGTKLPATDPSEVKEEPVRELTSTDQVAGLH